MQNADSQFYEMIPAFTQFDDYCSVAPYARVPSTWWVLIADIRDSTRAIQDGRYQDVNLAGASTIAAILNATKGTEIPFVFGGDGATFLIPQVLLADTKEALIRTNAFVQSLYQLEMRIGAIPVSDLEKRGARIEVAKYQLSPGNTLAFFRGGGLALADDMLKTQPEYLIKQPDGDSPFPDLIGLSCRWKPLLPKNGIMITLLIKARHQEASQKTYAEISQGLRSILSFTTEENSPISELQFEPQWPAFKSLKLEAHAQMKRLSLFQNVMGRIKNFFVTMILHYFIKNQKPIGAFEPKKYKKEMATNADFRKFDDMLRMVVDCTEAQAKALHEFLEYLHQAGSIFYGLHRSPQALMTCLVFSAVENQHVHFIDGADGGYAMASLQLKAQIRAAS